MVTSGGGQHTVVLLITQEGLFQPQIPIAIYLFREESEITAELGMISILFVNALLLPVIQVAEYFANESMWRKKKS